MMKERLEHGLKKVKITHIPDKLLKRSNNVELTASKPNDAESHLLNA